MAAYDNSSVVREIHQAFNDKDIDRAMSFVQADAKFNNVAHDMRLN